MSFFDIFFKGLPKGISKTAAIIIFIINFFAPGVGTIISAFLASECETETIVVGILQALTTPLLLVGFIWSIAWSWQLYKKADQSIGDEENPLLETSEQVFGS